MKRAAAGRGTCGSPSASSTSAFCCWARSYWAGRWSPLPDGLLPCLVLAAIAFTIDRRLLNAMENPGPQTIGPAVRVAVLSVITLNAVTVMAATGEAVPTLLTCALLAPAVLLKRVAAVT